VLPLLLAAAAVTATVAHPPIRTDAAPDAASDAAPDAAANCRRRCCHHCCCNCGTLPNNPIYLSLKKQRSKSIVYYKVVMHRFD